MNTFWTCIVIGIINAGVNAAKSENAAQCTEPEPVQALYLLDCTTQASTSTFEFQIEVTERHISSLSEGSSASIICVGTVHHILAQFNVTKDKTLETDVRKLKRVNTGDHMLEIIIDNAIREQSSRGSTEQPINKIVYLLIDKGSIQSANLDISKKISIIKYVVIIGHECLNANFKIVTDKENVFLLCARNQMDMLVERLKTQTCKGSLACGKDSYRRGKRCHPCAKICSSALPKNDSKCKDNCPSYWNGTYLHPPAYENDNALAKDDTKTVLSAFISAVLVMILLVVICLCCNHYCKRANNRNGLGRQTDDINETPLQRLLVTTHTSECAAVANTVNSNTADTNYVDNDDKVDESTPRGNNAAVVDMGDNDTEVILKGDRKSETVAYYKRGCDSDHESRLQMPDDEWFPK